MARGTGGRSDTEREFARIIGSSSDASESLPGRTADQPRTRNGRGRKHNFATLLSYIKVFAHPCVEHMGCYRAGLSLESWGLSLVPLSSPQGVCARGCARGGVLAAGLCSDPSRMSTHVGFTHKRFPDGRAGLGAPTRQPARVIGCCRTLSASCRLLLLEVHYVCLHCSVVRGEGVGIGRGRSASWSPLAYPSLGDAGARLWGS